MLLVSTTFTYQIFVLGRGGDGDGDDHGDDSDEEDGGGDKKPKPPPKRGRKPVDKNSGKWKLQAFSKYIIQFCYVIWFVICV